MRPATRIRDSARCPSSAWQLCAFAIGGSMMLLGCAAKTDLDETVEPTPGPTTTAREDATPDAEANLPAAPIDDGLRLPDMLALPSDHDLRRTATPTPSDGGVTARPPTEPPPRVRPTED